MLGFPSSTRLVPVACLGMAAWLVPVVGVSPCAMAQGARLVRLDEGQAPEFALVAVAGEPVAAAAGPAGAAPEAPAARAVTFTPPSPVSESPGTQTSAIVESPVRVAFGAGGSEWWTIGAGGAVGRRTHVDGNVYGAWSHFLADDIEFAAELGVWYYNQEDDDAVGINPNIVFRWHFVNEDDFTLYADIGIGVIGTTDNVPFDGTSFNFTPRAGVGATIALNDAGDERLIIGLRWAHVSNARINGDDNNPGIDTIMLYSGVQFPF